MDTSTISCILIIFLSIGAWVNFFINRKLEKKLKIAEVKLKEKEEMEQFDPQTLNLAYLYAKSLIAYGANVTEKWETATEQSANLEKAYRKGYYEGVRKTTGIPDDATNGDVFGTLFDIKEVEEMGYCIFITIYPDYNTRFIKEWWNTPYKKEKK